MDQRGRAEALEDVDQHDDSAGGLDDLMADHLLAGVVATLHQRARLDPGDQIDRRILLEEDDEVDGFERREHFRTRTFVLNRAIGALQPPHRGIAVEADDQAIAGSARRGQHLDVAGMQDVKAAIGEADAQVLPAPFRELCVERIRLEHDLLLSREISVRQDIPPQLGRAHAGRALLADGDGSGRIGHPQRRVPVRARRERHRKRGGDGVTGTGDVAHLHGDSRNMNGLAIARHQRHAVLALRDQDRLAIGEPHHVLAGIDDALRRVGAAAGRLRKFLAIGREQRGAAIDRPVQALGIDDHGLAERSRGVDRVTDHARGQHALGVVGEQYDVGARDLRQDCVDQLGLDVVGGRHRLLPIRAQHVRGKMLGDEADFSRGRPRRIAHQRAFDAGMLRKCRFEPLARIVLADEADKDAARPEGRDIARDVSGAADMDLAALGGDHGRRCFRRDPRHLAIDELVQHDVADAQHRAA
ncbi:hypothetical protein CDS [Bradyrhizobium sp.]|nr:hypothetical protein CDS [Bradyrhizobium sp.]